MSSGIFLSVLLVLSMVCAGAERLSVTDAFGVTRNVTVHPGRTVICYPSLLEIWVDCGGLPVGIHTPQKSEILPPQTEKLPTVGSYMHPNPEAIVQLKPDLVIRSGMTGRHRHLGDLLRNAGIEVLHLKYDNYSDYRKLSTLFTRLLGKRQDSGIPAQIIREVRTVIERCHARKGPTFLALFFNGSEFRAETDQAHAAYILSSLGGRNIVNGSNSLVRSYRTAYSREEMMVKDPDCIFLIPAAKSDALNREAIRKFRNDPALQQLKAVRKNRLHVLPPELFQYKPNKRFPDAFRLAERLLYPEP